MSLAPPTTQSRSWWSRSKSKDAPGLRSNRSNTSLSEKTAVTGSAKPKDSSASSRLRLNSLVASAMGKKKKQLPIQDPPPPLPPVRPARPPSLDRSIAPEPSVSEPPPPVPQRFKLPRVDVGPTIRRYYDADEFSDPHTISEPRTPSDHPRDRSSYQNSVMTFSDSDPFASNGIFSPFIQDPNRLSAYSDASYPDTSKRNDPMFANRVSYGSSSSNSHSLRSEGRRSKSQLSPPAFPSTGGPPNQTPRLPTDGSVEHLRHRRKSSSGLNDVPQSLLPQNRMVTRSRSALQSGSVSSKPSTIAPIDRNRVVDPSSPGITSLAFPQPPSLRSRAMTAAITERPGTSPLSSNFSTSGASSSSVLPSLRRKVSENFSSAHSPMTPVTPFSPNTPRSSHSPRTPNTPFTPPTPQTPYSAGPVSRSRTSSSATNAQSIVSGRPVVLVRKASAPRMIRSPPTAAPPPDSDLPSPPPRSPGFVSGFVRPTPADFFDPLEDTFESPSSVAFPDKRLSSSSSMSFVSKAMGLEDTGDAIYQFMKESLGHRDKGYGEESNSPHTSMKASKKPSSSGSTSSRPKILKKAASQHNLLDRRQDSITSVADSLASGSMGHDDFLLPLSGNNTSGSSKAPRKQRSFHHPRFPLTPLSLRSPPNASQTPTNVIVDQKKDPTQPRRRLFSGSSIKRNSSTHQQVPRSPSMHAEDDVRSLASIESLPGPSILGKPKHAIMFSSFGLETENACISSTWVEDLSEETREKRESHHSDYVPQHIMSPDAMLELEHQLEMEATAQWAETADQVDVPTPSSSGYKPTPKLVLDAQDLGLSPSRRPKAPRSRAISGQSDTSTLTGTSFATASEGMHLSSPSSPAQRAPGKDAWLGYLPHPDDELASLLVRSTSVLTRPAPKATPLSIRPATAQPLIPSPTTPTNATTITGSSTPPRPSTALPPPPRARPRMSQEESVDQEPEEDAVNSKRASVVPVQPLMPPPRRKATAKTVVVSDDMSDKHSQRSTRPPSAFDTQKILQRRSLMKKPSFLEISDDEEYEEDDGTASTAMTEGTWTRTVSPIPESSFLDLDRGKSFESSRSDERFVF